MPIRVDARRYVRALWTISPIGDKTTVGAPGFEPGTSCSQSTRAARLRHAPSGAKYRSATRTVVHFAVKNRPAVPIMRDNKVLASRKGKPSARAGRKATGLFELAGLPKDSCHGIGTSGRRGTALTRHPRDRHGGRRRDHAHLLNRILPVAAITAGLLLAAPAAQADDGKKKKPVTATIALGDKRPATSRPRPRPRSRRPRRRPPSRRSPRPRPPSSRPARTPT